MLILLSAAVAPGLALLSYFYLRNQMATEPRKTLLQAFFFGTLITFPIMFIQYVVKEEEAITTPFFADVLFSSGLEEFLNGLSYLRLSSGILNLMILMTGFCTVPVFHSALLQSKMYFIYLHLGLIQHLSEQFYRFLVMPYLALLWDIIMGKVNLHKMISKSNT